MSMNLHLFMRKSISGEEMEHEIYLVQTPTKVSYSLIDKDDVLGSYVDWINESFDDELFTKEHIHSVQSQIDFYSADGYSPNWEVY